MFSTKNDLLNWYSPMKKNEKIPSISDIKNWLWKYDFGTFCQTVIHRQNFYNFFSFEYVHSLPKVLLFRTHHLWNSTTELTLIYINTYLLTRFIKSDGNYLSNFGLIKKECIEVKTQSWETELLPRQFIFSNFSCMFLNPNNFSNLNLNCSNLLNLRNLQEQVKKTFFTKNCSYLSLFE